MAPSVLANPWKIGLHGDRGQVVAKFAEFAKNNAAVRLGARSLGGRRLWCHCRPHEPCHGDVLAELHAQELRELVAASPGEPAPFPRAQVFAPEAVAAMARVGKGEPLKVHKKGIEVHVVDGSGVCSPGKWLAKDRADVAPDFSRRARDILRDGVRRWCLAIGCEPRQVLFALAAGQHSGKDAPPLLVAEVACELGALVGAPAADQGSQPQGSPSRIDFVLLHYLAKAVKDPDADFPLMAQAGVPVGVEKRGGVNPMPRAAAIYEEKVK